MIGRIATAVMAILIASGFAQGAAAQQSAPVQVESPWMRPTIGRSTSSAAYMTLENRGSQPDQLVAASSPAAGKVELHENIRDGDVMKMREVKTIEIKPGDKIELKPGGLHMMLFDVKAPLKPGQSVPMTLRFERAGEVQVEVPVRQAKGAQHEHGAMQH